jgi:hypothetical protein
MERRRRRSLAGRLTALLGSKPVTCSWSSAVDLGEACSWTAAALLALASWSALWIEESTVVKSFDV